MKAPEKIYITFSDPDTAVNIPGIGMASLSLIRKRPDDLKFVFADSSDDGFESFFGKYHSVTGMRKTDKEAARKYWKRLTTLERKKAYHNIHAYYDSINDKQYCKKARTYLADKNFNDEFNSKKKDELFSFRRK